MNSESTQLSDGWCMVTNKSGHPVVYRVVGNVVISGFARYPVESLLALGNTIEPVEVCDKEAIDALRTDRAALTARIAELEAELAEARKWVPSTDYQTGSITYPSQVVAEWNTPEEDEAWRHLGEEPHAE
jgi:hypothetical protein